MKVAKIGLTFLAGALLLSVGTLAGEANKATLRLQEKVTVEGKQLTPGTYRLEWDGAGPDVRVNIVRGKETVATVPAHVVEQQARKPRMLTEPTRKPTGPGLSPASMLGAKTSACSCKAPKPHNTLLPSKRSNYTKSPDSSSPSSGRG